MRLSRVLHNIDFPKLVGCIALCEIIGVLGSFITSPALATWYNILNKPAFAPPGYVIGIIWITLYAIMGVSIYLVWMAKAKEKRIATIMFCIQLVLNAAWSFLFFGLHSPLYGFVEIIAMWIAIAATMIFFYKISRKAAYMLVPYIVWVTIAAYLNYLIMIMN